MNAILNLTDRIVSAKIGDENIELLMSSYAVNEISKQYGVMHKIGDILNEDNPEIYADTLNILTILTILTNAATLYYNFRNVDNKREILTQDYFLIYTIPADVKELKTALTECINKGLKRNITSEIDDKKTKY